MALLVASDSRDALPMAGKLPDSGFAEPGREEGLEPGRDTGLDGGRDISYIQFW